jgi:cytochrome b6-f complex subunit 5
MVEPLLSGIVLGLVPVTIFGLFVIAYLQFRRGDQLNILKTLIIFNY